LDGIINFNKPVGITSAKALYRVRSITGQRKSGHAGTLDPAASGVLILCLGQATKLVERFMDQPKVYRATARLDVTSESFDSDRPLEPVEVSAPPNSAAVYQAAASFVGLIEQVPPRISAVKVSGVPAYKRAARGQEMELKSRPAHIYWLHVHGFEWPNLDFEMCCGRGTYVRSLIRDWGARLGTGGCLTSLARTRVGPFEIPDGSTFDSLEAASSERDFLSPLAKAIALLEPDRVKIPDRPTSKMAVQCLTE
jgi:tRNA pseudouridine55 synthase